MAWGRDSTGQWRGGVPRGESMGLLWLLVVLSLGNLCAPARMQILKLSVNGRPPPLPTAHAPGDLCHHPGRS